MDLDSFIKVYDVNIPDGFLNHILIKADFTRALASQYGRGVIDTKTRNCSSFTINSPDENEVIWRCVDEGLKRYMSDISLFCDISRNIDGYSLLKYEEGQFFLEHTDMDMYHPRQLSIVILMNDDFEGGELSFRNGSYTPCLKKNQIIIFPSNFLYPHQVNKITRGCRYSIATWVT